MKDLGRRYKFWRHYTQFLKRPLYLVAHFAKNYHNNGKMSALGPFICNYCKEGYSAKRYLTQHYQTNRKCGALIGGFSAARGDLGFASRSGFTSSFKRKSSTLDKVNLPVYKGACTASKPTYTSADNNNNDECSFAPNLGDSDVEITTTSFCMA